MATAAPRIPVPAAGIQRGGFSPSRAHTGAVTGVGGTRHEPPFPRPPSAPRTLWKSGRGDAEERDEEEGTGQREQREAPRGSGSPRAGAAGAARAAPPGLPALIPG